MCQYHIYDIWEVIQGELSLLIERVAKYASLVWLNVLTFIGFRSRAAKEPAIEVLLRST